MEEEIIRPDDAKKIQPGEKGMAVVLCLVGLFFIWQSWKLYEKAPGASSYGAVPLFCSCLIVLFAFINIISDIKKPSRTTYLSLVERVTAAIFYIFTKDIVVTMILVVLYCTLLGLGAGFLVITPVFLWLSMCYLSRGNYIKNIIWTACCMLFIYMIFVMLFHVVLP